MDIDNPKPFLIGLSGPSSSGKTTIARLLRSICNINESESLKTNLIILHQDDFYKTDTDIPVRTITSPRHGTRDLQDWDCVESIDLSLFKSTLNYVKKHGFLPPDSISKEDQNEVGESGVNSEQVEDLKKGFAEFLTKFKDGKDVEFRIVILDGFLLYPESPSITEEETIDEEKALKKELYDLISKTLNLKLFLPGTKEQTLNRRARRSGYVTLEGFWADPPGYVEDVVWPNFVRDHGWMIRDGDVDGGETDQEKLGREAILVAPGKGKLGIDEVLTWALERLKAGIEDVLNGKAN